MQSYNDIFEASRQQLADQDLLRVFSSFRDNPGAYHFVTAVGAQRFVPDDEAIGIAYRTNPNLLNRYASILEHDLAIGAHSLSEMDIDIFRHYLNTVLTKSKYLFYATHNQLPSPDLVQMKLALLSEYFDIVTTVASENNTVSNILYKRK